MRTLMLAGALLACSLPAQNFVTNGDFSGGLAGWTETGFSVNPGIETFDVTGLGASQAYGCHHGGQAVPPPYPSNTIEQTVTIPSGVPLEFTADLAVDHPTTGNGDAGTFWVTVGGVEVARSVLGAYEVGTTMRARLAGRYVPTVGGAQLLQVHFTRSFLAATRTPRVRIDNLRLFVALGPTFCLQGNRRLNTTVQVDVFGKANSAFGMFLSAARTGGLQVPGIQGTLFLDPATLVVFFTGAFDANGAFTTNVTIPDDQGLLLAPLYVQGLHVDGHLMLGNDQFLTFVL